MSVILVLMCIVLPSTAKAEKSSGTVNSSYSYWLGYKQKKLVQTKDMYELYDTYTGKDFGYNNFAEPSDLFFDKKGNLYVLEKSTSRLTILDNDFKFTKAITEFIDDEGSTYNFAGSNGVFVDDSGIIYIADTFNARILKGDIEGKLIEEFVLPQSSLIPEDFIYQPMKIAVNSQGYMYIISNGSTYGSLLLDSNGVFQGFYGANTVKTDIGTFFKNIWSNFFATDEQLAGQVQKIPFQFTDICLGKDDFAYTVTGTTDVTETTQTGQIRCLSPKGKNILTVKDSEKYSDADSFNFGDLDIAMNSTGTSYRFQNFVSVEVDDDGYIYALDATYGRVYVYDSECNLLTAFGGGMGVGEHKGTFMTANTVVAKDNILAVSDSEKNSISIFQLTEYGKLFKEADTLYIRGKYTESKNMWQTINTMDPNCQLSYQGLAKAYLVEKDYENALKYSKQGLDYVTYNQAFSYTRNESLRNAFGFSLAAIFIFIILIIVVKIYMKKRGKKFELKPSMKLYFNSFLHPFEFANSVKFQKQGSLIIATVSIVLFYIFKVLGITNGGFMFSKFDKSTYSSFYTLLGSVGVVLLWVIAFWGVAVLFSGKCKLKEIYIITGYALLPQIVNGIFYLIASNVLIYEESITLTVFATITLILSGIVIAIGCMVCSEYSFFKFSGVAIVSVLGMCLIVFVIFMVLTLDQQLITFIQNIFKEITYR